jgi:hypothetical protein
VPDNEWSPKAPSLSEHFEPAHSNAESVPAPETNRNHEQYGIPTLDSLESLPEPAPPAPRLTPTSGVEYPVHRETNTHALQKSAYFMRSLQRAREIQVKEKFNRYGRGQDKDFDRSDELER